MSSTTRKPAAQRDGSTDSATAPVPAATNGANAQPTPPPADAAFEKRLAEMLRGVPQFIRLPKPGERCQFTQLSRGAFYEMVAPSERNSFRPAVKATYRKSHRGAQRGIWIVPADRLFRHLLELEADSSERFIEDSRARAARGAEKGGEPEPQPTGNEVAA